MIKAIAVDDEPLALRIIAQHAAEVSFISLQQTFTDASAAADYLSQHKTDVLFVDIRMPDINGLQLAQLFKQSVQVVFTTAYPDYAVQGFELEATDYLLKPISLIRFLQACRKVQNNLQRVQTRREEVFLKESGEWIKVSPDTVVYAEAKGNYLKLVTADSEYLLRMTFEEVNEKLGRNYLRVHKSFIINPTYIDRIENHQVTLGINKIPVGMGYRQQMLESLGLKANTKS